MCSGRPGPTLPYGPRAEVSGATRKISSGLIPRNRKSAVQYRLAVEAARNGFDEIQFDYVRFPDRKGLKFAVENSEANRVKSISGFLAEAKSGLPLQCFSLRRYLRVRIMEPLRHADRAKAQCSRAACRLPLPHALPLGFQFGIPGTGIPWPILTRSSLFR